MNRKTLGLIFLVLGFILLITPILLSYQSLGLPIISTKQKEVSCDVTVGNPLGVGIGDLVLRDGDLKIEDVVCSSEEKISCGLFNPLVQGIISDKGTVKLNIGGKSTTKSIKVTETNSKTINIGLCVPVDSESGFVSIITEEGKVTNSKEVNF